MTGFSPRASATLLLVLALCGARPAPAEEAGRQELALELARVMLDATARQRLDEQVGAAVIRAISVTLQERLNRPLQEVEWQMLADIVTRLIGDMLPPNRTDEITARVYASHFDDAELRELLRFQRSAVGQKAARLGSMIATEAARAIEAELRDSAGMPRLLEELGRAFPVLRHPESP